MSSSFWIIQNQNASGFKKSPKIKINKKLHLREQVVFVEHCWHSSLSFSYISSDANFRGFWLKQTRLFYPNNQMQTFVVFDSNQQGYFIPTIRCKLSWSLTQTNKAILSQQSDANFRGFWLKQTRLFYPNNQMQTLVVLDSNKQGYFIPTPVKLFIWL